MKTQDGNQVFSLVNFTEKLHLDVTEPKAGSLEKKLSNGEQFLAKPEVQYMFHDLAV